MRPATLAEWVVVLRSGRDIPPMVSYPVARSEGFPDDLVVYTTDELADLLESLDNPKDLDRDTMKADAANPSQLDPDR